MNATSVASPTVFGGGIGAGFRFVALGDSVTAGVGDLVENGWRGWAAILAEALASTHGASFTNLATIGATVPKVRDEQLQQAIRLRPTLASLVVGVNDTMRSTFDPVGIRRDLIGVAAELTDAGALLLTVRYHDHGKVFGLPAPLRRSLWRRIGALNAVYDDIHATYGGLYVDLAANPEVYTRAEWSVDRLHPSERGHRRLAWTFAHLLAAAGLDGVRPPSLEPSGGVVPSKWQEVGWLVTAGIPWVARRARDLAPWAVRMAMAEATAGMRRRASAPDAGLLEVSRPLARETSNSR